LAAKVINYSNISYLCRQKKENEKTIAIHWGRFGRQRNGTNIGHSIRIINGKKVIK
jgi:hypothetical protein